MLGNLFKPCLNAEVQKNNEKSNKNSILKNFWSFWNQSKQINKKTPHHHHKTESEVSSKINAFLIFSGAGLFILYPG